MSPVCKHLLFRYSNQSGINGNNCRPVTLISFLKGEFLSHCLHGVATATARKYRARRRGLRRSHCHQEIFLNLASTARAARNTAMGRKVSPITSPPQILWSSMMKLTLHSLQWGGDTLDRLEGTLLHLAPAEGFGLWPRLYFLALWAKKDLFTLFLLILDHFCCSVVT